VISPWDVNCPDRDVWIGSRNGEATPNQRDTNENLANTIYLSVEEVNEPAYDTSSGDQHSPGSAP
jgi:hypothetical protein